MLQVLELKPERGAGEQDGDCRAVGSGKTTLLRILPGFWKRLTPGALSCRRTLFDENSFVPAHPARIGFVPQGVRCSRTSMWQKTTSHRAGRHRRNASALKR